MLGHDPSMSNVLPPVEVYCGLMEEIKFRIGMINTAAMRPTMPQQLILEFGRLQLRLVCEIIAIACLAIHNEMINIKALEKLWSANEIMVRLQTLNPNFFPVACLKTKDSKEEGIEITDVKPEPLNKTSFISLYGRCGNDLHRGDLRRILSSIPAQPPSLQQLNTDVLSIMNLLRMHRIAAPDYKKHYVCVMENTPKGKCAMITADGWSPL
jgi:hypothetical protein